MIDSHRINSLFDADVVDADGSRIGTVKHVYVDPDGGQPLFAGVTTGWFGRSESFVPLRDADFDGEVLHVEYDKDTVKHAPRIDADGTLTDDDIDRIQEYYDGGGSDESGDGDTSDHRTSAAADDQRAPRERIRVHRYVIADERTGTPPVVRDDEGLEHRRTVGETENRTAAESHVPLLEDSGSSAADESRDPGELRRRTE